MVLGGDVGQNRRLHNALGIVFRSGGGGKGLLGGSPVSHVVATDADEVRKMWCA